MGKVVSHHLGHYVGVCLRPGPPGVGCSSGSGAPWRPAGSRWSSVAAGADGSRRLRGADLSGDVPRWPLDDRVCRGPGGGAHRLAHALFNAARCRGGSAPTPARTPSPPGLLPRPPGGGRHVALTATCRRCARYGAVVSTWSTAILLPRRWSHARIDPWSRWGSCRTRWWSCWEASTAADVSTAGRRRWGAVHRAQEDRRHRRHQDVHAGGGRGKFGGARALLARTWR